MCLGVPGEVLNVKDNELGITVGRVSFSGIVKEVCLAYTPEVQVGDYVIVHAGFAISVVDEQEARRMVEAIQEVEERAQEQDEPLFLRFGGGFQ